MSWVIRRVRQDGSVDFTATYRDPSGRGRKRLALDYLGEVLDEHPTTLLDINEVGPINAAKVLVEVGDVRRFPSRHHFASYTGTAPVDVSSGDTNRHRLNRGGNRRLNHALHLAAVVQYRMPGPGPDYYRRKRDQCKTHLEALRCLKTATLRRRLPPPRRRPGTREPGRTSGDVSSIQRG